MATAVRPTLAEIISRVDADAQARMDADELSRSDTKVVLRVIAGVSHELYSAIEYGRKQLFTQTAETAYLERRGLLFGIVRRQASRAAGAVQFTWAFQVEIPRGTLLQTATGAQYETTAAVSSDGTAAVRSVEAGAGYDLAVGAELSLVSAIAGVSGATVTVAVEGGADAETDEELRARVLARTQTPPRQGTKEDFVAWAQEVEGVGKAWCYPREMGDGTVTVRFLDSDGAIPDSALVAKVQEHIETVASVLCKVYVQAPVEQKADFTLSITPDNLTVRTAAKKALASLFKKEAEPGGTIYLSHVHAALSAASGETDHKITLPADDIVAQSDSFIPVLGEVTWTD